MVEVNYSNVSRESRWFLKKGYKLSIAQLSAALEEECFVRLPDPFSYLWHTWTQNKGRLVNKLSLRGKYFDFQYGLADILKPLGLRSAEFPPQGSLPLLQKDQEVKGFVTLQRPTDIDLERLERLYESLLKSAAYLHVFLRWICQQALDGKNVEDSIALLPDGDQKESLKSFTEFRSQFLDSFFSCKDVDSLEEHVKYLEKRAERDLLVGGKTTAEVAVPYIQVLTKYRDHLYKETKAVTPRVVEWAVSWANPMTFWDQVNRQRKYDQEQVKTVFREYIGSAFKAIPWEFKPNNNSIVSSLPLSIFSDMKTPF
ncbi:MAG: hypothetical protein P1V97_00420 [Planctomycetota bacterium]|nr:hypothetical protein [Planctomycetota bacterium]